eukprot:TRINITY_DN10631_c0_g1_i1.p1 TRINITY_DN10631_c0_g1~~TRINITY_DN10631_c0_g1_i1.p1  ORF type:complete len:282 (-),score=84.03 TRINITY_DN10631_c0_g1_i1:85-930(-)
MMEDTKDNRIPIHRKPSDELRKSLDLRPGEENIIENIIRKRSEIGEPDDKKGRLKPLVILLGGGPESGKSELVGEFKKRLENQITELDILDFVKPRSDEATIQDWAMNSDVPDGIDWKLLIECVEKLADWQEVECPMYDRVTRDRSKKKRLVKPRNVLVIHGVLALVNDQLRDLSDLNLFLSTDADTRLSRRIIKKVFLQNEDLVEILDNYIKFVKPSFDKYCQPSVRYANIVIPPYGGAVYDEATRSIISRNKNPGVDLILSQMVSIARTIEQSNKNGTA